jgi:tetratricopeptide (TPR) repeat protein
MKKILTSLILLIPAITYGQDYQSEFQSHCQTQDTVKQLEVLQKWKKDSPNDPELFTSYFNYYFSKSRKEVMTLSTEEPTGQGLTLTDSTGKTAGYMGSQIHYDDGDFNKGISKINEGIKNHPNRLDMRFGKIYSYGQKKDWETFTTNVIATVEYSEQNNNQWTWTNNSIYKGGKEGFLKSLQDYQLQLYNTGDDDLLINMRRIANAILKVYPNHVASLSNLSITYLLTKQYDKAISALKKAEQIDPEDYIVLSNIAHGYKLKGDKNMAIAYYKKVVKYGDEGAKSFAKEQIEMLKKN